MESGHNPHHCKPNGKTPWITNIAFVSFLIFGGYYLATEHRAHFFGILPFLLLLSCPVMHLFMHHGHKHKHVKAAGTPTPSALEIRSGVAAQIAITEGDRP